MTYVLSQLNQTGVPPLLHGIERPEQWAAKEAEIRRVWLDYIGPLPVRPSARMHVRSCSEEPDHTRLHVEYETAEGDSIPAYLLMPDETAFPRPNSGYPAVIAMHPTNETGKEDIATTAGRKNRMYALELVRRGYAVLAPDALTAGERIYPEHPSFHSGPFYERYPEWSIIAKNTSDHMQAVDVLCSLDEVNPNAVGAIGHSFGGYNAYFLAGMDSRIKAVVSSCGFSPFARDPEPEHWSYRRFPYTHIPKLAADLKQDRVPFEFHEIAALSSPVPSFHYSAQEDHIFPHWVSVAEGFLELAKLYRLLGQEERFRYYIGAGDHDFPPEMRGLAYSFLDRWLKETTA